MTSTSPPVELTAEHLAGQRVAVFAEHHVSVLVTVSRLLSAQARVVVVSDDAQATIEDLGERGLVEVCRSDVDAGCLYGVAVGRALPQGLVDVSHALRVYGERLRSAGSFAPAVVPGTVTLVGSGPGRADLVTLGALAAVSSAEVIITDRLISWTLLAAAKDDAEVIDVAKVPRGRATRQEDINAALIAHATAGRAVARVKGGDPFVFGRGMEEYLDCVAAGIGVHVISGVSSSIAVPASTGVPVTHRGVCQSFTVVSGHVPPGDDRSTVNWPAVSATGGTIVVLMGVKNAPKIAAALLAAGRDGSTPVVAVQDQAIGAARRWDCTLEQCADGALASKGCVPPAVLVIGDVVSVLPTLS